MDHPDILSVIAPMADDCSLRALFCCADLYPLLRVILTSQNYWYERAQHLISRTLEWRPKADWKEVYYTLKHLQSGEWLLSIDPINNLDSLLAAEEFQEQFEHSPNVICENEDDSSSNPHWFHYLSDTSDLGVLNYVLQKSEGHRGFSLWAAIEYQLDNSHTAIVDKLLMLVSDDELDDVLLAAIRTKRRDIFDRLEHRIDGTIEMYRLFLRAIEVDDLEMYKHLLSLYGEIDDHLEAIIASDALAILRDKLQSSVVPEDELQYAVSIAVTYSSVSVLTYLATLGSPDWRKAIEQALTRSMNNDIGVRYALDRIAPDADLTGLLIHSQKNSRSVFRMLLADPRSHPEKVLPILVSTTSSLGKYAIIRDIIRDSRVKTEEMEPSIIREVYNAIANRRIWADAALARVTASDLSQKSAFALIARQIVFKRPKTDAELTEWMTSLDNPIVTAATSLLVSSQQVLVSSQQVLAHNTEVRVIRALLLAMVHPDLSQQDLIDHLVSDGYGPEEVERATTLLSLRTWYLSNSETIHVYL